MDRHQKQIHLDVNGLFFDPEPFCEDFGMVEPFRPQICRDLLCRTQEPVADEGVETGCLPSLPGCYARRGRGGDQHGNFPESPRGPAEIFPVIILVTSKDGYFSIHFSRTQRCPARVLLKKTEWPQDWTSESATAYCSKFGRVLELGGLV